MLLQQLPLTHKGNCTMCGSLHFFTRFWGSSISWHMSVFYFYCRMIFRGRDSPYFVLLLISWWTFKLFPLFSYYKQCCSEHLCTSFCVDVSFLLGIYLGVEFQGHMVTIFSVLRNSQTVLQSGCTIVHAHQQCIKCKMSLEHLVTTESKEVLFKKKSKNKIVGKSKRHGNQPESSQ